jgi:hypothetical protein
MVVFFPSRRGAELDVDAFMARDKEHETDGVVIILFASTTKR